MNAVNLVFTLLLVLNVNSLVAEDILQGDQTRSTVMAIQPANQPPEQQLSLLFWSYVKYVDPFYYWKKHKLQRLEQKIREIELAAGRKVEIWNHQNHIALISKDIDTLEKITTVEQLKRNKDMFVSDYVKSYWLQYAPEENFSALNEIFSKKNEILKELRTQNKKRDETIKFIKQNDSINDQEIDSFINEIKELERQKEELRQQIESYDSY